MKKEKPLEVRVTAVKDADERIVKWKLATQTMPYLIKHIRKVEYETFNLYILDITLR